MLQEWKTRPLEEVYPFIFLDAIHYKFREDGRYTSKVFYTVLGVGIPIKLENWKIKMARIKRVVIPYIPHHITQRDLRSMNIFFKDEN